MIQKKKDQQKEEENKIAFTQTSAFKNDPEGGRGKVKSITATGKKATGESCEK
jgi:hypothetical protein